MSFVDLELWLVEVVKSNVREWRVFAEPVTYACVAIHIITYTIYFKYCQTTVVATELAGTTVTTCDDDVVVLAEDKLTQSHTAIVTPITMMIQQNTYVINRNNTVNDKSQVGFTVFVDFQ